MWRKGRVGREGRLAGWVGGRGWGGRELREGQWYYAILLFKISFNHPYTYPWPVFTHGYESPERMYIIYLFRRYIYIDTLVRVKQWAKERNFPPNRKEVRRGEGEGCEEVNASLSAIKLKFTFSASFVSCVAYCIIILPPPALSYRYENIQL